MSYGHENILVSGADLCNSHDSEELRRAGLPGVNSRFVLYCIRASDGVQGRATCLSDCWFYRAGRAKTWKGVEKIAKREGAREWVTCGPR